MNNFLILCVFLCGAELVAGQSESSAPLLLSGGANQKMILVVDSTKTAKGFQVMGDGRVFARELEITVKDFPDYVFDPAYPLLPLDSLKSYVLTKRHLPNLPSVYDISSKGNTTDVAQLLKLQMEKIEELTLYILQLQDRIKALEEKK